MKTTMSPFHKDIQFTRGFLSYKDPTQPHLVMKKDFSLYKSSFAESRAEISILSR